MSSQTPQKRLFVTGASGHTGSVVTELAVADGYKVTALSRSETSDEKLRALGAEPVRGDLASLDILRRESAAADAVIHLAMAWEFGSPDPYESVRHIDYAAVDAIADGLAGTGKPLVITSGTLTVDADPSGAETTEATPVEANPVNTCLMTERHSLGLAERDIRVIVIRLAPYVYGRGRRGVATFMGIVAKAGCATVIEGGTNCTTVVHVDDAARLFLLAAEKGRAGEIYNASASTEVTSGQLAEAMAEAVGVPLRDISKEDANAQLGPMLAFFFSVKNRASGAKARRELSWKPQELGIFEDIKDGLYKMVARALEK